MLVALHHLLPRVNALVPEREKKVVLLIKPDGNIMFHKNGSDTVIRYCIARVCQGNSSSTVCHQKKKTTNNE